MIIITIIIKNINAIIIIIVLIITCSWRVLPNHCRALREPSCPASSLQRLERAQEVAEMIMMMIRRMMMTMLSLSTLDLKGFQALYSSSPKEAEGKKSSRKLLTSGSPSDHIWEYLQFSYLLNLEVFLL